MTRARGSHWLGGALIVLLLVAAAWTLGRATAPRPAADEKARAAVTAPVVRMVAGVPVGMRRSRAGALAAADNYVAAATETIVQDPSRYERLVNAIYAPRYRATALKEGVQARQITPVSVTNYAAGGQTIVVVAARRLVAYDGLRADVRTWVGGVTWGPERPPGHTWTLVDTRLRWHGGRWLIERIVQADRPAPAPRRLGYEAAVSLRSATFTRELEGMAAPVYGG